jgi:hypothetical protein
MRENKLMEIRVNKNRKGPLGKIMCVWDHENAVYRQRTEADKFGKSGVKSNSSNGNGPVHIEPKRPRGMARRPDFLGPKRPEEDVEA